MATKKISFTSKGLSALLMFVFGFAGASFLGAIILMILIVLGIVPKI